MNMITVKVIRPMGCVNYLFMPQVLVTSGKTNTSFGRKVELLAFCLLCTFVHQTYSVENAVSQNLVILVIYDRKSIVFHMYSIPRALVMTHIYLMNAGASFITRASNQWYTEPV